MRDHVQNIIVKAKGLRVIYSCAVQLFGILRNKYLVLKTWPLNLKLSML